MAAHLITTNIHGVTSMTIGDSRPLSCGGYSTETRIETEDGRIDVIAYSDAPLPVKADAAQTAAYAEGRKDERKEWEALRAQMLAALQEVFVIGDRLVDDVYGHEFVEKARAAIRAAAGEQP